MLRQGSSLVSSVNSWLLPAAVLGGLLAGLTGCGGKGKGAVGSANMTSAIDRNRCSDSGKQIATADTDGDKKPDVYKFYANVKRGGENTQAMVCKQVDLNHDGGVDIVYHYGDDGAVTFEEFDLDFDRRFDLRAFYQGGRKVREEMDTNYDQRVDFTKYYEADKLVRIERDGNNDGRVDEWMYYEGGKLDRIGYDSSGSGRVDRWERAPDAETTPAETAAATGGATGLTPPATGGTTPPATGAPIPAGGAPTSPPQANPVTPTPTNTPAGVPPATPATTPR